MKFNWLKERHLLHTLDNFINYKSCFLDHKAFQRQVQQAINLTHTMHHTLEKQTKQSPSIRKRPPQLKLNATGLHLMTKRAEHLSIRKRKKLTAKIREEAKKSFKEYITKTCQQLEEAFKSNDSRTGFKLLKRLTRKYKDNKFPETKKDKSRYSNPQEIVDAFGGFYTNLFSEEEYVTTVEPDQTIMEQIPEIEVNTDIPTEEEVATIIESMKNNKATGPDSIPAEVLKESKECLKNITQTIQVFWCSGHIVTGDTVLLYK